MKVLNLCCTHEHHFEGWFGSEADYLSQHERGLVECPLCGDKRITRLPSAPRLNVSGAIAPAETPAPKPVPGAAMTTQSMWQRALAHVLANSDDVGERFAEEARRIHYGETEERAIHGRATAKDAAALAEEGIEVMSLPVPVVPKGSLQ
jgi:hypothetical protein